MRPGKKQFQIQDQFVTLRYPNGNIMARGNIFHGKKHGIWEFYRENGTLHYTLVFQEGVLEGTNMKHYGEKNDIIEQYTFQEDVLTSCYGIHQKTGLPIHSFQIESINEFIDLLYHDIPRIGEFFHSAEDLHPASVYPGTAWEVINTGMYLEKLPRPEHRDRNDKLMTPEIITVIADATLGVVTIHGYSEAPRVLLYTISQFHKIRSRTLVVTPEKGGFFTFKSPLLAPGVVREKERFTLVAQNLYKEGFSATVQKEFYIEAGWKRDLDATIAEENQLEKNTNLLEATDRKMFIWRRIKNEFVKYPYAFVKEFREYHPDGFVFREGSYIISKNLTKELVMNLDGMDTFYQAKEVKLWEQNWDSGYLNPTVCMYDQHGHVISHLTYKNNMVHRGYYNVMNMEHNWNPSVNFYNVGMDENYKEIQVVVGDSYNQEKIYKSMENQKG